VNKAHDKLSLKRQCELLKVNRSTLYYRRQDALSDTDIEMMNRIRDIWLVRPFYGYRRIHAALTLQGRTINHKRVQRLMQRMEIKAIYPRPRTSDAGHCPYVYPYLLPELSIHRPDVAWGVDITYLKVCGGVMYLVAIIDIYSRYIVGWRLSNTLETQYSLEALSEGLCLATPDVVNSDQGSQYTSEDWVSTLQEHGILVSMDGKGRCLDNITIERFWRSLKYEEVYLKAYDTVPELRESLRAYIEFYNTERPHQSLGYKTPKSVYFEKKADGTNGEIILTGTQTDTLPISDLISV